MSKKDADVSDPDFSGWLTKRSEFMFVFFADTDVRFLVCSRVVCKFIISTILNSHPAGQWLKEWRRRYFFLKGNQLHFAKGPSVCAIYLPLLLYERAS